MTNYRLNLYLSYNLVTRNAIIPNLNSVIHLYQLLFIN